MFRRKTLNEHDVVRGFLVRCKMRSVFSADRGAAKSRISVLLACCILFTGCPPDGKEPAPPDAPDTSAPVVLTARADPAKARIGEPITFRITLEVEPGLSAELPEAGSRIQGLRIVDMGKEGPKKREGRIWSQRWYELRADLTGSYVLPAVSIPYTDSEGKDQVVETKQVFVEVESVLGQTSEEQDIRDLKSLEKAKRELPRWWPLLLLGILLIPGLLAGLILYFRRKRRARETHRTPEELAMEELENLEATGLLEEARYREYVFGLSLIFRRYLEGRFHVPAAEQTTEEILTSLRMTKNFDKVLKEEARSFLEETDPVKYRGLEPRPEETEAWRGRLVSFMERSAETEDTREAA
jgi:hypothetical protein